jgi:hypothetical protein
VLRHCNQHLGVVLPRCYLDDQVRGPWILEDINYSHDQGPTYIIFFFLLPV